MTMSSESSEVIVPVPSTDMQAALSSTDTAATDFFEKALGYLHGRGMAQDDGMAAASFLDASDLDHPEATIMAALLYYVGIGVTRNLDTASEYAQKYIVNKPQGTYAETAREIISGSLGTENGRRLLYGDAAHIIENSNAEVKSGSRKTLIFIGGAVGLVILLIAGGVLISSQGTSSLPEGKTDIALLISDSERDLARKDASSIAATLKADALSGIKKADEEESAKKAAEIAAIEQARVAAQAAEQEAKAAQDARLEQVKAMQAQAQAAQEQARAQAAEAQARGQAAQAQAAQARAAQVQSRNTSVPPDQLQQLRAMYASAMDAMHRGEYDRATGIADTMLALTPNNPSVLNLKNTILQNRKQALGRLRAD